MSIKKTTTPSWWSCQRCPAHGSPMAHERANGLTMIHWRPRLDGISPALDLLGKSCGARVDEAPRLLPIQFQFTPN